jgi:hypothetical protein
MSNYVFIGNEDVTEINKPDKYITVIKQFIMQTSTNGDWDFTDLD